VQERTDVHLVSWGLWLPERTADGARLARDFGVPVDVMQEKIGIRLKHVPGPDDGCAAMASRAARIALERAGLAAADLDAVVYCGSEYKEHIVWNAAARIQQLIGATGALSFEVYALCAGLPIALRVARDMMAGDARLRHLLVVTASREGDLVDPRNPRTRWMANFGAGAGAIVLSRDGGPGTLAGFAGFTDARLAMSVVQPAGGTARPASRETVEGREHRLDVTDMDAMRTILEEISLPAYLGVVDEALEISGRARGDVTLLGLTHMKTSFHRALVEALGIEARRAIYLDGIGHIQSVDQVAALEVGRESGLLDRPGVVVLAAAGTGYTWSAMAIEWKGE